MIILTRILTLIYIAILCFASMQPSSVGKGADIAKQVINNMLHVPAYGLLTYLTIKSFPKFKYIYIVSFLFVLTFGIFNEYLQSFVPGRYASGADVLLNGIGSLSVVLFCAEPCSITPRR